MPNILLNESDASRQKLLRKRLREQGSHVWSLNRLHDAESRLGKRKFDLMILDLDAQRIDDITVLLEHCQKLPVLLQASGLDASLDFRCWIADELVEKIETGDNVVAAVKKLLAPNRARKSHAGN